MAVVADNGGKKDDSGKLRFDLIPGRPLEEVAKLYTHGASCYDDWNWRRGMKWSRMYAAMLRHLFQFWWHGTSIDPESDCHHLSCVVFYAFGLMEYDRERLGIDDRIPPQSLQDAVESTSVSSKGDHTSLRLDITTDNLRAITGVSEELSHIPSSPPEREVPFQPPSTSDIDVKRLVLTDLDGQYGPVFHFR